MLLEHCWGSWGYPGENISRKHKFTFRYPSSKQLIPFVTPITALWFHNVTSGYIRSTISVILLYYNDNNHNDDNGNDDNNHNICIYDMYMICIWYMYSQFVAMKSTKSMSQNTCPLRFTGGYRPLCFLEYLGAEEVARLKTSPETSGL